MHPRQIAATRGAPPGAAVTERFATGGVVADDAAPGGPLGADSAAPVPNTDAASAAPPPMPTAASNLRRLSARSNPLSSIVMTIRCSTVAKDFITIP
jgi:hypothetical protein